MLHSTIMIHLPKPCPVKWESMTAANGGRDCSVCKKFIPDFSGKTESEIVAAFENGWTCGSFRSDQVSDGSTYGGWSNYFSWKTGIALLLAGSIFLISCRRRTSGMYNPNYSRVRIHKQDSVHGKKRHIKQKFFAEPTSESSTETNSNEQ
jgi:hypothetical protein